MIKPSLIGIHRQYISIYYTEQFTVLQELIKDNGMTTYGAFLKNQWLCHKGIVLIEQAGEVLNL